MSNLKVGMRVVAVTDYPEDSYNKRIKCGDFGTITGSIDHLIEVQFDGKGSEAIYPWRVEAVTEEPKQMKATDKITVEITLAELAKIYAVMGKCNGETSSSLFELAGKTLDPENKRRDFMDNIKAADTVYFHQYEREFMKLMFPEHPKKSKEQIKIEELQATIDRACREIKELREMGEKSDYNSTQRMGRASRNYDKRKTYAIRCSV